jgi:alkylated DNA repair dioxygenase AlkB
MPPSSVLDLPANLWESFVCDKSREAYFYILPHYAYSMHDTGIYTSTLYEKLLSLPWTSTTGRSALWLTRGNCVCPYRYGGRTHTPVAMPDWLSEVTDAVANLVGISPSEAIQGCNVNMYADTNIGLPFHADNEPLFYPPLTKSRPQSRDITIVSLSIGRSRVFQARRNFGATVFSRRLFDGDILTMSGKSAQDGYQHAVASEAEAALISSLAPIEDDPQAVRFNLTLRTIQTHCKVCPCRQH